MNSIFPSRALLKMRFWLSGAALLALGAALALSAPHLVWAQSMNPQESVSPDSPGGISVTNPDLGGEILHMLPYVVVLTLMLVLLLGWFIFAKPTTKKGKAAEKRQNIENEESFIA